MRQQILGDPEYQGPGMSQNPHNNQDKGKWMTGSWGWERTVLLVDSLWTDFVMQTLMTISNFSLTSTVAISQKQKKKGKSKKNSNCFFFYLNFNHLTWHLPKWPGSYGLLIIPILQALLYIMLGTWKKEKCSFLSSETFNSFMMLKLKMCACMQLLFASLKKTLARPSVLLLKCWVNPTMFNQNSLRNIQGLICCWEPWNI